METQGRNAHEAAWPAKGTTDDAVLAMSGAVVEDRRARAG